jgi:putative phosphoesterase
LHTRESTPRHRCPLRIGLISDTHGLLREEASAFLRGCDHIIHGGDIGREGILDELNAIAPLTVVRGNIDTAPWARQVSETEFVTFGTVCVYVLHDLAQLDIDPAAAGVRVVVSGHSHSPRIAERDGVLYVNPGSAGPRRFKLPIAAGELAIADDGEVAARTVELPVQVATRSQ